MLLSLLQHPSRHLPLTHAGVARTSTASYATMRPDLNASLVAMRALLYDVPSADAWEAAMTLLEDLALHSHDDAQTALDYAAPLLAPWPDDARPVLDRWWQQADPTNTPHEFYPRLLPLSRTLRAAPPSPSPREVARLCDAMHGALTALDLDLPNFGAWKPKERQRLLLHLPRGLRALTLRLSMSGPQEAQWLAQATPPALRSLHLSTLNHSAQTLGPALPQTLEHLHLEHLALSNPTQRQLLRHLPRGLRTLTLDRCSLGPDCAESLTRCLPPHLETLRLPSNDLQQRALEAMAPALPPSLRTLDLNNNRAFRADGLAALGAYLPPTLEDLDLSGCFILAGWLPGLLHRPLPPLARLNLWCNQLGDEGTARLADRLPTTLTHLNLGCCRVGPTGLRALWPKLPPKLTHLSLSNNLLGPPDVAWIADRLPRSLQALRLHNNPTHDLDLNALFPTLGATLLSSASW